MMLFNDVYAGAAPRLFRKAERPVNDGLVSGWASVIEENGRAVIDSQGDVLDEDELCRAAHQFITESRIAGHMHVTLDGRPVKAGTVVESVVFSRAMQRALGINLGRVGWWIVVKVDDPDVRKEVAAGRLNAFSIGGAGRRVPVDPQLRRHLL